MGAILGYVIIAICAGAGIFIFIDIIRDKTPTKKILSIMCVLAVIAGYAVLIWQIRTNPALVHYRETYGCKHILLGLFGGFMLTLLITGILDPLKTKRGNKREKAAHVFECTVWYLRIALIASVPIILALEIS